MTVPTVKRIAQQVSGLSGRIHSLQRGTVTHSGGSGSATITAVDLTRSHLNHLGYLLTAGGANTTDMVQLFLGTTTVSGSKSAAVNEVTWGFEVVERWPGTIRSIQRLSNPFINITFTFKEQVITLVDSSRTRLFGQFQRGSALGQGGTFTGVRMALAADGLGVTQNRNASSGEARGSQFEVVEEEGYP